MSVTDVIQARHTPSNSAAAFRFARAATGAFRALIGKIVRAYENDKAFRQLSAMSDHQLRDIGVSRAEIRARVYGERS